MFGLISILTLKLIFVDKLCLIIVLLVGLILDLITMFKLIWDGQCVYTGVWHLFTLGLISGLTKAL